MQGGRMGGGGKKEGAQILCGEKFTSVQMVADWRGLARIGASWANRCRGVRGNVPGRWFRRCSCRCINRAAPGEALRTRRGWGARPTDEHLGFPTGRCSRGVAVGALQSGRCSRGVLRWMDFLSEFREQPHERRVRKRLESFRDVFLRFGKPPTGEGVAGRGSCQPE